MIPALVIRVEVEGPPRIFIDAVSEREGLRLLHWLANSDSLIEASQELLGLLAWLTEEQAS